MQCIRDALQSAPCFQSKLHTLYLRFQVERIRQRLRRRVEDRIERQLNEMELVTFSPEFLLENVPSGIPEHGKQSVFSPSKLSRHIFFF